MQARTYIFIGLLAFIMAASIPVPAAQANNGAALVLAQNDSGKKQGFWSHIFNRSNKQPNSKPVFLDPKSTAKPQNRNQSRRANPYDFSTNSKRPDSAAYARRFGPKPPSAIEEAKYYHAAAQKEALELDRAFQEKIMKKHALRKQGKMPQDRASSKSSDKIMVYDPEKARNYDPNNRQGKSPRIYNTR